MQGETYPPVIAVFEATTSAFDEAVDHVKEQIDSLSDQRAEPEVGLETEDFDEEEDSVSERLSALDAERAEPTVSLDTAPFDADEAEVTAQVAALDDEEATVTVNADVAPAESELAGLQAQLVETNAASAGLRQSLLTARTASAGAADANERLVTSLLDVQRAFDAGTASAAEYAAATALSDEDADELEARFSRLRPQSLLKQIGITDIIARLTAMGLVGRTIGNDLANLNEELISQEGVLYQYGIVLTDNTVSIGGLNQALANFASEGIADVSFGLKDLDPTLLAFQESLEDFGPSTVGVGNSLISVKAGAVAAADAVVAFTAGMRAAEEGDIAFSDALMGVNGEMAETTSMFASMKTAWEGLDFGEAAGGLTGLPFGLGLLPKLATFLTTDVAGGISSFASALSSALPEESEFGGGLSAIASGFGAIAESSAASSAAAIFALSALVPVLAVATGGLLGLVGGFLEGAVEVGVFAAAVYGAGVTLSTLEDEVKSAFHDWAGAFRSTIEGVLGELPSVIEGVMDDMTPVLRGAITGFHDMFALIDQDVHSSGFKEFFDWVGEQAPRAAVTFTEAFQGIMGGFSEMAKNASPFITMLESGLISLGHDLTHFGRSTEWKDFIGYLVREAPEVDQFINQLWGDVEELGIAFAELGEGALPLVVEGLKVLNPLLKAVDFSAKTAGMGLLLIAAGATELAHIDPLSGLAPFLDGSASHAVTLLREAMSGLSGAEKTVSESTSSAAMALTAFALEAGISTKQATALETSMSTAASAFRTAFATFGNISKAAVTIRAAATAAGSATSSVASLATVLKTAADATAQLGATSSSVASLATVIRTAADATAQLTAKTHGQASGLQSFWATQLNDAKNFVANVRRMAEEGYSPTLISQVVAEGTVTGGALAHGYAEGGRALAHYVNSVQRTLDTLTGEIQRFEKVATTKAVTTAGWAKVLQSDRDFLADVRKMVAERYNATLVTEVAKAGPVTGGKLAAIYAAHPAMAAQVNAIMATIAKMTTALQHFEKVAMTAASAPSKAVTTAVKVTAASLQQQYEKEITTLHAFGAHIAAMEKEGYSPAIIHQLLTTKTGAVAAAALASGGSAMAAWFNGATQQIAESKGALANATADAVVTATKNSATAVAAAQLSAIEAAYSEKAPLSALAAGVQGGISELQKLVATPGLEPLLTGSLRKSLEVALSHALSTAVTNVEVAAKLPAGGLGSYLMTEAAGGVTKSIPALTTSLHTAVHHAVSSIKPSTADPAGMALMQGLAQSVRSHEGDLHRAFEDVIGSAASGLGVIKRLLSATSPAGGVVTAAPATLASAVAPIENHVHVYVGDKELTDLLTPKVRSKILGKARGTRTAFGPYGGARGSTH